jgi:peroxiredoxin
MSRWRIMGVVAAIGALTALAFAAEGVEPEKPKKKAKPVKAKIGEPAPEFTLKDYAGKTFDLSTMKDKIVVLEWFNKDCPYCKMYCEDLKKTAAKYAEKGVVWAAVDSTHFRKNAENAKYAKEHEVTYPILSDFDGKIGRMYGATNTPHVFIINKGTLVYSGAFIDRNKKNPTISALDEILAGEPVTKSKTKPFG